MTFNEWIDGLEYFIRIAGDLLSYLVVFRGQLRASPWVVAAVFSAACIAEITLNQTTDWMINVPAFLVEMGMFFFFFRERRVMNYTAYCSLIILFSCFGSLAQGGLYGLVTAMDGASEWLVKDQAGPAFRITAALLLVPAYALACLLTLKLKPAVMNARGWLQAALVASVAVPYVAGNVIKGFVLDLEEYTNNPDGIGLVIDGVRVVLFFGVTVILVAKAVRDARLKAGTAPPEEGDEEAEYREASRALRRERHDAANWAAAGLESKRGGTSYGEGEKYPDRR